MARTTALGTALGEAADILMREIPEPFVLDIQTAYHQGKQFGPPNYSVNVALTTAFSGVGGVFRELDRDIDVALLRIIKRYHEYSDKPDSPAVRKEKQAAARRLNFRRRRTDRKLGKRAKGE